MYCFPIVGGHHLNSVPGATIEKSTIWSFADTLLAANTKIRIDFDAAEGRMVLVGNPEHAGFDGTVFYACRRARAPRAAVSSDGQDPRSLFARCLAVAFRHGPMFIYDVVHVRFP